VAATLALTLALCELGLWLADISYPEFGRMDEVFGWAPWPGARGIYAVEGRTELTINAAGFRDVEHVLAKPPGTIRIAVLGDSLTEAREVALEDTYWRLTQRALSACLGGDRHVEVLSFGVNGYGTAQEYMVLTTRVWRYEPDIVLLAFFTGNDVWNSHRALDGHEDRPYFVLREGALALDDTNLRSSRFRLAQAWTNAKRHVFNRLRTLQVLNQAYRNVRASQKYADFDLAAQLGAGLDPGIYREPVAGPWAEAWSVTEALIDRMARSAAERRAQFWLMTLTNPAQVYPDPAVRAAIAQTIGVPDLDYPDRRLASLAARLGIPLVRLVEPLRRLAEAEGTRLHGSDAFAGGHWNAAGHGAVAAVLAGQLCTALNDGS